MKFDIVFFWLLLIAFVVPAYYFALSKVLAIPQVSGFFARWGYPRWVMRFVGFAEMAACLCLLLKPLLQVGIVCYGIFILGAFGMHLKHRSSLKCLMVPVFVGLHLMAIYLFTVWLHSTR